MFQILSFYKYARVEDPARLQAEILAFCLAHELRGKIYVAEEGINGNISAPEENAAAFRQFITAYQEFADLAFKTETVENYVYRKMHVRVKKELVHLGIEGLTNEAGGKRLKPVELLQLYASGKKFVIIDTRNRYESEIGYFKDALRPEMQTFRDWERIANELEPYKDTPVVTYCTGGIRCEKASALLVQKGFREVYQLDGGIITYVKELPDTVWQGGVFVFDDRKVIEPNTDPALKYGAACSGCGTATNNYINCHNLSCDKLLVLCKNCAEANGYCCSESCRESNHKRTRIYP
jgi:UPF0176 protein